MAYQRYNVQYSTFAQRGFVKIPSLPHQTFRLGCGHSFADRPAALLVHIAVDGSTHRILAVDNTGGRIAQIWPPYEKNMVFQGKCFLARVAVTALEIAEACALLRRIHTEGAAAHGMLLCLYALADDDNARSLVGVAQIGEYYHTHFPGRAAFGRRILGPCYLQLGRGEVIKAIPIAAAKRFAIAEERQGEGLGSLLALQTLKVARDYRWPSAGVVEVSRYRPGRKYYALCCNRHQDFLTSSGYVPVPPRNWLRNGQIDGRIAANLTDEPVAGYYYADLTSVARPPFVGRAFTDGASAVRTAGD